jgi:hypothetical protein
VAELAATVALFGVLVGLSGTLAFTYYSWLGSFTHQAQELQRASLSLSETKVSVVAASLSSTSSVWLYNYGQRKLTVTEVYSDGSKALLSRWSILDAVTGAPSSSIEVGRLSILTGPRAQRLVIYFDTGYGLEVSMAS